MPSVIKGSYIRGKNMAAKAAANINYIQNRPDEKAVAVVVEEPVEEKEKLEHEASHQNEQEVGEAGEKQKRSRRPARQMHSESIDNYSGAQLKKQIATLGRNDVVHKLIISPGVNGVDMKAYVREVMTELGQAKGQTLQYGFVIHTNTDHSHAHVVMPGRDMENGQVRLDKLDFLRMRAFGDRFLEREYNIERVLDRDMEDFCRTRNLNPMFEQERGADFYDRLYKKDNRSALDHLEWEKVNSDWQKFIMDKEGTEQRPNLGRSSEHEVGRISDVTGLANNDMLQGIWKDIGDNHPEMKDLADEKLEQLGADRAELLGEAGLKTRAFDPHQQIEDIANQINKEQKQFQDLMKNGLGPNDSFTGIDLTRVANEDQLEVGDKTYTKYDSLDVLLELDAWLQEDYNNRIPRDDYVQLWTWIGAKEFYGEGCYGEPPRRKERERDKPEQEVGAEPVAEQSKGEVELAELNTEPGQQKEVEEKGLTGLDNLLGFGDEKQLDLEHGDLGNMSSEVEQAQDRASRSLDDLLGFEDSSTSGDLDLAPDIGLMNESPLDFMQSQSDSSSGGGSRGDDSDSLFGQGIM